MKKKIIVPVILAAAIVAGTAGTAAAATLADRNAYIRCVAPNTEITQHQRERLLGIAYRALEGYRAHVPSRTLIPRLAIQYHLTYREAEKVYYCAVGNLT